MRDGVWGIRPRNKEQHCALDLLLADDVKLVTLVGKAGTGKTMLAIAAGLQKVVEERTYSRLLVSRPDLPARTRRRLSAGRPRAEAEPVDAAHLRQRRVLDGAGEAGRKNGRSYRELIDLGFIEIEPLTYIRGRSIPNQYIIVDEAQNLTPHEVKTIITRVGEATKIVLTGDPYQIDNPYVDATSNGLTTIVETVQGPGDRGPRDLVEGRAVAFGGAGLEHPVARLLARGPLLGLGRQAVENGVVAAEALGDEVFEAIGGAVQPPALAVHLLAGRLLFLERAEVLLEAGQTVFAHGRGLIDVA